MPIHQVTNQSSSHFISSHAAESLAKTSAGRSVVSQKPISMVGLSPVLRHTIKPTALLERKTQLLSNTETQSVLPSIMTPLTISVSEKPALKLNILTEERINEVLKEAVLMQNQEKKDTLTQTALGLTLNKEIHQEYIDISLKQNELEKALRKDPKNSVLLKSFDQINVKLEKKRDDLQVETQKKQYIKKFLDIKMMRQKLVHDMKTQKCTDSEFHQALTNLEKEEIILQNDSMRMPRQQVNLNEINTEQSIHIIQAGLLSSKHKIIHPLFQTTLRALKEDNLNPITQKMIHLTLKFLTHSQSTKKSVRYIKHMIKLERMIKKQNIMQQTNILRKLMRQLNKKIKKETSFYHRLSAKLRGSSHISDNNLVKKYQELQQYHQQLKLGQLINALELADIQQNSLMDTK
ncbi:MAG: hypothetical protein HAW62_05640 [Endozoicomonadaceae bacterium]|nr:hypothetical protein [Endozoicomonadaceae bacterium]